MPETEPTDVKTSLRMRPEMYDLWDRVARHMGLKKAQVFTVALRELARREGVAIPATEETAAHV